MKNKDVIEISVLQSDRNKAAKILGSHLKSGSLALAIGAGTSSDLGLPNWFELVRRCMKEAEIDGAIDENTPNDTLRSKMEQVENKKGKDYSKLVHDALYEGVEYSKEILKKELLIALGALLMGSRRGSVSQVFNFNFDNVLDWYLSLHGYTTQIVTDLPTLREDVDVTIYHPHGYLPKDADARSFSKFLVFSKYSYAEKLANFETDLWIAEFRQVLRSKELLFVGLSGEDPIFDPLLVRDLPMIQKRRYTGFWLFGPNVTEDRITEVKKRNVVPLRFDAYNQIPDFLFRVCQEAASL